MEISDSYKLKVFDLSKLLPLDNTGTFYSPLAYFSYFFYFCLANSWEEILEISRTKIRLIMITAKIKWVNSEESILKMRTKTKKIDI